MSALQSLRRGFERNEIFYSRLISTKCDSLKDLKEVTDTLFVCSRFHGSFEYVTFYYRRLHYNFMLPVSKSRNIVHSNTKIHVGHSELDFIPLKTQFKARHDKTNKVSVHPAKTQIRLGICPVWAASSLSAWRKLVSLAIHCAQSEDSDQTGRMPRLIWVFAGWTLILLVLSFHVAAHFT